MRATKKMGGRSLAAITAVAVVVLLAQPTPEFFWPGFGISLLGALLRLWACGYLQKNKVLAVGGPYAHLQHPLYLGTFLGILGLFVAVAGARPPGLLLAGIGLPGFLWFFFWGYFPRKRRNEGDRLERRFGEDYRRWSLEVPALIPRFRPYRGGARQTFDWKGIPRNSESGMFLVFLAGWATLYSKMAWFL